MGSIVTFSVSEKQIELKNALFSMGYKITLYHVNKTPKQAALDVQKLCEMLQINLEKCLATDWTQWHGILDQSSF